MPKVNSSRPSSKRPITGSRVPMAMPGTKKQRPRPKIALSSPEPRTKAMPVRAASTKPSRRWAARHGEDHADVGAGVDGEQQEDADQPEQDLADHRSDGAGEVKACAVERNG